MKFTIKLGLLDKERGLVEAKSRVREADSWEDVPLAAVPIIEKGWPEMPDYMDGRQYFLWLQNDFQTNKRGEPIIKNPYPIYTDVKYVMGGKESRMWGA